MHTLKKFIHYYQPYKLVFFIDLICAAIIRLIPHIFTRYFRNMLSLHLPPVFASILIYASLSLNMSFLVVFPIDTRYNVGI